VIEFAPAPEPTPEPAQALAPVPEVEPEPASIAAAAQGPSLDEDLGLEGDDEADDESADGEVDRFLLAQEFSRLLEDGGPDS
jgi:hypothetical protein